LNGTDGRTPSKSWRSPAQTLERYTKQIPDDWPNVPVSVIYSDAVQMASRFSFDSHPPYTIDFSVASGRAFGDGKVLATSAMFHYDVAHAVRASHRGIAKNRDTLNILQQEL
jgi:hypothetical protein